MLGGFCCLSLDTEAVSYRIECVCVCAALWDVCVHAPQELNACILTHTERIASRFVTCYTDTPLSLHACHLLH